MVASSALHLKWLHKLEMIDCQDGRNGRISYQVEDFFDTEAEESIRDVETFLDNHHSKNVNLKEFILKDIFLPVEHSLRCGVRDVDEPDEELTELRRNKAAFIIGQVIPRIYFHKNFSRGKDFISHGLTRLLKIIVQLAETISRDDDNVKILKYYFKAKQFLSFNALQIWAICISENGVPIEKERGIPYIRKLAMLDCLDYTWNYVGGFENILRLLEERLGDIRRIAGDKCLHENSELFRRARHAIRCQVLGLTGLEQASCSRQLVSSGHGRTRKASSLFERTGIRQIDIFEQEPQMSHYFPKCSTYFCSAIETSKNPHRLRCNKCYFYHWCSPGCQEYSEYVSEHHYTYCQACPKVKADECRAQMEEYLNMQWQDTRDEAVSCRSCGLAKKLCKEPMIRCETCIAVNYCSKTCQDWDFEHGGHDVNCKVQPFER
jgi:hypothetical protein